MTGFALARLGARRRLPAPARRARRWAFYVLARGLVGWVGLAPRAWARATLLGLAWLAWCDPRRRSVVRAQLERAFPSLDERRRRELGRHSLRRLAFNLADTVRGERTPEVAPADAERIDRLVAGGRPVVVLMGHLGAWELAGPVLVERTGGRFAAVVADGHNARVAAWLRRWRRSRGIRTFDRDRELRPAARWLREGGWLAVLADHRPRGAQVLAPWWGHPAPTAVGPARLASAAGAWVLPVAVLDVDGRRRLCVGEGWRAEGSVESLAARGNRALEDFVRRSPEEWTWFHDRCGVGSSRSSR